MTGAAQGTQEWLIERSGHATASCFDAVCAKIKGGEAATRRAYRIQLVTERLTGKPTPKYQSIDMLRGKEQEPFARMAYEARTGLLAIEAPFRKHPTIEWCGCSPDGEVDDDGLTEIKCVLPHVQVVTILAGAYPAEHTSQIQGALWVTGRQWCDFVSYSPDLPGKLALYVFRVERDDEYIANLEAEVTRFLGGVDEVHKALLKAA